MGVEYGEIEQLKKTLIQADKDYDKLCVALTKEIAARLLSKVIKRTPVGNYGKDLYVDTKNKTIKYASFKKKDGNSVTFRVKNVKKGGTLRRGWTGGKSIGTGINNLSTGLKVSRIGDTYVVEINNPIEYASYVEFGHRTTSGGYVEGRYMLTLSEKEINRNAPKIIENKIKKWLEGAFSG